MVKKSTCKNISEDANLPLSQQPSRYKANYGQIRSLMKRLNDALSNNLKNGRPCKFCKRCGVEVRPAKPCRRKARKEPVIKKQRKWRQIPKKTIPLNPWKHRKKSIYKRTTPQNFIHFSHGLHDDQKAVSKLLTPLRQI